MENRKRPLREPRLLWRTPTLPFNTDLESKVWDWPLPRRMGPQSTGGKPCVLEDPTGSGGGAKKKYFFRPHLLFLLFYCKAAGGVGVSST